jgi:SAM-dependent methyltransferase
MRDTDYKATYVEAVNRLLEAHPRDAAMKLAVGGEFEAFGALMRAVLIRAGLKPEHYLIDVGCGSGRLAIALRSYLTGRYLGLDVVPELLAYAREASARPDWRFEEARGMTIPERDETADMVCFFSVLTHLMHEDGFRYLREARRVLKPGGIIVFSFLDFVIDSHWTVFSGMMKARDEGETTHHNQFMGRDAALVWAARLEMDVVAILDGNTAQVQLDADVTLDDGRVLPREASFGQSICILRKASMNGDDRPRSNGPEPRAIDAADYQRLQDELLRSAVRVSQLEARLGAVQAYLAEAERSMERVKGDVQTIVRTKSWRIVHSAVSALRAMVTVKRK